MCKRYAYRPAERAALDGPYEGRTMQLELSGDAGSTRDASCRRASFPWWALWLIWPLVILAKWVTPLTLGMIAALGGALGGVGLTIAAVAMIVVGGALLLDRGQ